MQLQAPNAGDRIGALRSLVRVRPAAHQIKGALARLVDDPSEDVRLELLWAVDELLGDAGIEILDSLSHDDNPLVREATVRTACKLWDRPQIRDMCGHSFEDRNTATRVAVLQTLAERFPRDADSITLFRRGLTDPMPQVQRAAVFGCQAARDAGAVPLLVRVARSAPDLAAVPAVEEALAAIATAEAIAAMLDLLEPSRGAVPIQRPPSVEVRAAAARTLARLRVDRSRPRLRALLLERDPRLVISAMESLIWLRDAGAVQGIVRNLSHPDVRVRRFALRALRQIGDPSCAVYVRHVMIQDSEAVVRAGAVLTFADILGVEAVDGLSRLARDPDPHVRLEAAGALAGLGKPAAGALARFVRDVNPDVRSLAVNGLGQAGDRAQITVLAEAARTPGASGVRIRADVARALGMIGDPLAMPALLELARDEEPLVRARAALSLGGIRSTDATHALEQLARDPFPQVRAAARSALTRQRSHR